VAREKLRGREVVLAFGHPPEHDVVLGAPVRERSVAPKGAVTARLAPPVIAVSPCGMVDPSVLATVSSRPGI
jgi:hypothetical protein